MPMTTWREIAGHKCDICNALATHFYGDITICCDCHQGTPPGTAMDPELIKQMHEAYAGKTEEEKDRIEEEHHHQPTPFSIDPIF